MSIVGRSLQTTRTHRFVSVCVAPGQIKVAWTTGWSTSSSLFDIHGQHRRQRLDISSMSKGKRVDVQLLGADCTEPDSLSLIFFSSTSTRSKVVLQASQCRERQSLLYSLSLYHDSQLHRNINQPARKQHLDDIELAQDCTARIPCRKGSSAPYRELWRERKLIIQVTLL